MLGIEKFSIPASKEDYYQGTITRVESLGTRHNNLRSVTIEQLNTPKIPSNSHTDIFII